MFCSSWRDVVKTNAFESIMHAKHAHCLSSSRNALMSICPVTFNARAGEATLQSFRPEGSARAYSQEAWF